MTNQIIIYYRTATITQIINNNHPVFPDYYEAAYGDGYYQMINLEDVKAHREVKND